MWLFDSLSDWLRQESDKRVCERLHVRCVSGGWIMEEKRGIDVLSSSSVLSERTSGESWQSLMRPVQVAGAQDEQKEESPSSVHPNALVHSAALSIYLSISPFYLRIHPSICLSFAQSIASLWCLPFVWSIYSSTFVLLFYSSLYCSFYISFVLSIFHYIVDSIYRSFYLVLILSTVHTNVRSIIHSIVCLLYCSFCCSLYRSFYLTYVHSIIRSIVHSITCSIVRFIVNFYLSFILSIVLLFVLSFIL